uniref:Uncharacterized protein n=1 Tax=Setaria viridis TaxID=4556 RepID=A0A4V6DDV3_SETVI|nr:hypothetical protein SEVIR_2G037700v2 [Setaria viridis]
MTRGSSGLKPPQSTTLLGVPGATHQKLHSSTTVRRRLLTFGDLPSKTQAFLCFQTSNVTRGEMLPWELQQRCSDVGAAMPTLVWE